MVPFLSALWAVMIENRYISANETKTDQVKISFASQFVGMCRWDYCVYTESYRALLCIAKWLLVGPWSHTWKRSFFFTECFQACWISQRKLWDWQLVKSWGFSDHESNRDDNIDDAGWRQCIAVSCSMEFQKQAFILVLDKGLLLSGRNLFFRHFHTPSIFLTRDSSRCDKKQTLCREIQITGLSRHFHFMHTTFIKEEEEEEYGGNRSC